jgi:hypothetical protein
MGCGRPLSDTNMLKEDLLFQLKKQSDSHFWKGILDVRDAFYKYFKKSWQWKEYKLLE